jgi:hypothetical protein
MAMRSRASARVSRRMSQRNILALRPYGVDADFAGAARDRLGHQSIQADGSE